MGQASSSSHIVVPPPRFGFRPKNEELIKHYLKAKITGNDSDVDKVIVTIENINNCDPSELPWLCSKPWDDKIYSYFFSKWNSCGKGNGPIRKTKTGSWNKTGKDLETNIVSAKRSIFPFKRRLTKTDYVMHVFEMINNSSSQSQPYVLCRLHENTTKMKKSKFDTPIKVDFEMPIPPAVIPWVEGNAIGEQNNGDGLSFDDTSNGTTPLPTAETHAEYGQWPEDHCETQDSSAFPESEVSLKDMMERFYVPRDGSIQVTTVDNEGVDGHGNFQLFQPENSHQRPFSLSPDSMFPHGGKVPEAPTATQASQPYVLCRLHENTTKTKKSKFDTPNKVDFEMPIPSAVIPWVEGNAIGEQNNGPLSQSPDSTVLDGDGLSFDYTSNGNTPLPTAETQAEYGQWPEDHCEMQDSSGFPESEVSLRDMMEMFYVPRDRSNQVTTVDNEVVDGHGNFKVFRPENSHQRPFSQSPDSMFFHGGKVPEAPTATQASKREIEKKKKKGQALSSSDIIVPPAGFRFRPTNEELVNQYLKPKITGNDCDVDKVIVTIENINNCDPSELPWLCSKPWDDKIYSYFFCKWNSYGKGNRFNRQTKTSGQKTTVRCKIQVDFLDQKCLEAPTATQAFDDFQLQPVFSPDYNDWLFDFPDENLWGNKDSYSYGNHQMAIESPHLPVHQRSGFLPNSS